MKNIHFIDCGANIGSAVKWAINKYKKRLIKIDAFEPESINYSKLLATARDHQNPRDFSNIMIHKKAVWIKNEVRSFNVQHWGTRTGSSLMDDKEQIIKAGQYVPQFYMGIPVAYGTKISEYWASRENRYATGDLTSMGGTGVKMYVQCIDLSDWIFNNLNRENYNVLKIDIEGAEFEVIDHLLNTGAHEYIDEWLVEFTEEIKVPKSYNQEVVKRFESTVSKYTDWGKEEL
jgi:FkbM family methyltransferase